MALTLKSPTLAWASTSKKLYRWGLPLNWLPDFYKYTLAAAKARYSWDQTHIAESVGLGGKK